MDSTILRQIIEVLKDYKIECEVCTARFRRDIDYWIGSILGEFKEYDIWEKRWR